jgi:hypothetical protein
LLNSSGSPWAVRWFRVPVSLRFNDNTSSGKSSALVAAAGKKRREEIEGVSTTAVISAVVAAGLVGVAVGRYARLG